MYVIGFGVFAVCHKTRNAWDSVAQGGFACVRIMPKMPDFIRIEQIKIHINKKTNKICCINEIIVNYDNFYPGLLFVCRYLM